MQTKVHSHLYCMRIDRGSDNSVIAVDVRSVIMLDFYPTAFTYGLVACLIGFDGKKEYELRYKVYDDKDLLIYDTQGIPLPYENIKKGDSFAHLIPKEFDGITISLMFNNMIIKHPGIYTTKIYIDEQEIAKLPLYFGKKE